MKSNKLEKVLVYKNGATQAKEGSEDEDRVGMVWKKCIAHKNAIVIKIRKYKKYERLS